ncbi:MAG: hypothetical protein ABI459_04775 [Deltaproteobacteria bacterium]
MPEMRQQAVEREANRRERTAMQRLWARREQQITAVVASTVGLFGDFQGIAGQAIGTIPSLELPGADDSN